MMLTGEMIIENIVKVEFIKGDIVGTYVVTFTDGSQLEVASDRIYTYPMLRTSGFAEKVSVFELQRINLGHFNSQRLQEA